MENTEYGKMGNSELKLLKQQIEDEFEVKKAQLVKLGSEIEKLQKQYADVNNEINLRKNIF